jgi:hypothetical protein
MNATTIQHFILFFAAALCYGRAPAWAYLAAAIVLIELDQARSYADPWWAWFRLRDTWLDIIAGADLIGNHIKEINKLNIY